MSRLGSGRKKTLKAILGGLLTLLCILWTGDSPAAGPDRCAACHLGESPANLALMSWRGPVLGEEITLCPGVRLAKRQLFLTESRLASLGEVLRASGRGGGELSRRLAVVTNDYRKGLLDPVYSLAGMERRLSGLRARLNKGIYRPLLARLLARRKAWLWFSLAAVCLVLCAAALLGFRGLGRGGKGQEGMGLGRAGFWGAMALVLFLAAAQGLWGCQPARAPSSARRAASPEPGPAQLAGKALRAAVARCQALCGLGGKAASVFPDLARAYLEEALAALERMPAKQALSEAGSLSRIVGQNPAGKAAERAGILANDLASLAREAWPFALVCSKAHKVDPELARRALEAGLAKARVNPQALRRDWDLRALALSVARHRPAKARQIAGEVQDPAIKSSCYLGIAQATRMLQDVDEALAQALRAATAGQRALGAARADALYASLAPRRVGRVFGLAFKQALDQPDLIAAPWLAGETAALLAGAAPDIALSKAMELRPVPGAGFKALAEAAKVLLVQSPERGKVAMQLAQQAAQAMEMPYEKGKALCLLARRAELLGLGDSQRILAEIPPNQYFLQSEARVAMVLFQARRAFDQAVSRARQIRDPSLKAMALARLAALRLQQEPEQGKELFREVFALCGPQGARLDPALWEPAWQAFPARRALTLAERLGGPAYRARVLSQLAAALFSRGEDTAAKWSLFVAQKAINSLEGKQTLDKVGLLGDMGREWSVIDMGRARRYFELGAEAARALQ